MKKMKLAGKYILLSIVKVFNDLMIRITNGKTERFLRNKLTIACAIIAVLTITNQAFLRPGPGCYVVARDPGPSCYVVAREPIGTTLYTGSFLDNIKLILTQK